MTEITRNLHALLIGVGDYDHPLFVDLPATVRDVEAINGVLTDPSYCGFPQENVEIIHQEQANAAGIRDGLVRLARSVSTSSSCIVCFSGHGGRACENGRWNTYLCPRDTDPKDLGKTAISGDEFSGLLARVPAKRLLVIIDACHAGGSAELKSADGQVLWKAGINEAYYDNLIQGSGRVVMASSKAEQVSYVRSKGDLSIFIWYFREALLGKAAVRRDGLIRVLDVFHYVNEMVQKEGRDQTPILKVKDLDLNFPIALDRGGKGSMGEPGEYSAIHYDTGKIRKLLNSAFSDRELFEFIYDDPMFRPVYDTIGTEVGKARIVQALIEHADRNLLLSELLRRVEEHNPVLYNAFEPYTL